MSIKLMSQVWELDYLKSNEKILLLALSDNSNDEGLSWPSNIRLQRKCGFSPTTLNKYLKILKYAGILTSRPRGNVLEGRKTNSYQINHSCLHTGVNIDRLRISREKVKAENAKFTDGRKHAPYRALGAPILHTGVNKPLGQYQGKNIRDEALQIADELESQIEEVVQ
jgi:predicted transcriptional regulator